MPYRAMYIWTDGTQPTHLLRSKTKVLDDVQEPPIWGFDGSSTNQAPGDSSDVVLRPVKVVPDPIRRGNDVLVLCECLNTDMSPHPTNTRAALAEVAEKYAALEPWFGMEQEYNIMDDGHPHGFPKGGYPAPQGPYYCGVGSAEIYGRDVADAHSQACIDAGLAISGTNAEVMTGQWEFQIGPLPPLEMADQLIIARWMLYRIGEDYDLEISIHPKPMAGDWNGAGCHTNFSTNQMRDNYDAVLAACKALGENAEEHMKHYGVGVELRLTGEHETQRWDTFSYGVSDRGASVRIPWQVEKEGKGYIEDRRPNANCDPYIVTRLITETVCSTAM
ncbi:MAG: glutamine synthetase beta-grasp domain-containing protein [Acidimicrobiia bacterium]|nr:glutamine synthetase beta-grasp domain-containing protein [Acidimicrobiia bacterium]